MKLLFALLVVSLTALITAQAEVTDAAADQPTAEYLPPTEEVEGETAPLEDDGYHYKTVRKLKYRHRHRREVSQEYLPPLNEPLQEYLPPIGGNTNDIVADDGYRYKTIRKLKFRSRHRREVPQQEYLPPINEPLQEYLPPAEDATALADDGYRYKSVRKLKLRSRHRRDVGEIEKPSDEYLPPVDVALAPELKTIVGDDGYRYKTIRRLKYRRHRREADAAKEEDENAAPAADYLPPAEVPKANEADDMAVEPKSAELAQDGYRYKTVRRIRYRHRK